MRFIDHATDGGCSKKADAGDLTGLLLALAQTSATDDMLQIAEALPDSTPFVLSGVDCLSTVDIVLPMVLRAADFGRIAVNHVLGDIYAAFGVPQFALSILGLPYGLQASAPDVVELMRAAASELHEAGARLIGGHTLVKQADLSLGFSVVGLPMQGSVEKVRAARVGDPIYLTKPLGTSAATYFWKHELDLQNGFEDVLDSLLESSFSAARSLFEFGIRNCTDVTGFGFINHLHRLLLREGIAAEIDVADVPRFLSLKLFYEEGLPTSSLHYQNLEFAARFSNAAACSERREAPLLFDAQVAGGLVLVCPAELSAALEQMFAAKGNRLFQVGRCRSGAPGEVFYL